MSKRFVICRKTGDNLPLYLSGKTINGVNIPMWNGNINFAYCFGSEQEAFEYWNAIPDETPIKSGYEPEIVTI